MRYLILFPLILSGCTEKPHREVCKIVKEIVAVEYRRALIQFTDGQLYYINQEKIRPGDNYCYIIWGNK